MTSNCDVGLLIIWILTVNDTYRLQKLMISNVAYFISLSFITHRVNKISVSPKIHMEMSIPIPL